ncbi:hypothetical protein CBR_g44290 [Chara braunii]|uniref:Arf-GAP domain-containing protein n=1 Tax=Chara braunii TaxID=69332 RepID=A0A388K2Y1_CHABU|nr:hypothetical protein CBR_g44290 [Chara braunii]|eukprot:GBG64406.1 hypothetical protein CBR_g44290 [Chara braunii]
MSPRSTTIWDRGQTSDLPQRRPPPSPGAHYPCERGALGGSCGDLKIHYCWDVMCRLRGGLGGGSSVRMGGSHKSDLKLQAKNQKILSELLRLPANEGCAECGALFPRYASVTFGVFLCDRCFGIHRSIGAHISRTKSVSLDAWSAEEVALMKEIGNQRARTFWENNVPTSRTRPSEDSPDSVVEAWVRDKYERRQFCPRMQTAKQLKSSSPNGDTGPSNPRPLLSSLALPTLSSLSSSLPLSVEKSSGKETSNLVAWASGADGSSAPNGGTQKAESQSTRSSQSSRSEKSKHRSSSSGDGSRSSSSRREDSSLPRTSSVPSKQSRKKGGSSTRSSSADGSSGGSKGTSASEPLDSNWDPFGKDADLLTGGSISSQDHIVRSRSADLLLVDNKTAADNKGTSGTAADWFWSAPDQQRSQQRANGASSGAGAVMELELLPQQRLSDRGGGVMVNGGMNGFEQALALTNGTATKTRATNNPFAEPDLTSQGTGGSGAPDRAGVNGEQWDAFSFPTVSTGGNTTVSPPENPAMFGWPPLQGGMNGGGAMDPATFQAGGMMLGPQSRSASAPNMGALDLQANHGAVAGMGLTPVWSQPDMTSQMMMTNGFVQPAANGMGGLGANLGRPREMVNGSISMMDGFHQQPQIQQHPGVWLGDGVANQGVSVRTRNQQQSDPFASLMSGFGNMRLSKGESAVTSAGGK